MRAPFALLITALSLALVVACSTDEAAPTPTSGDESDAGGVVGEESTDAGAGDAEASVDVPAPEKATRVEAKINDVSRTLERAQFGVTKEGASETLYFEAHEGGVEACPETETPKRTLIVNGVPDGAPGARFTMSDGVRVSLIDFAGDQITTPKPLTTATAVTVTIVAVEGGKSAEIEVEATFAEGTAKGRVYATYCAAMSQ
ncbi:MAG: hypothetical protein KF795_17780 [Labilithrix sp.]|nr:hypothetical protein [Labilithrix sp.]